MKPCYLVLLMTAACGMPTSSVSDQIDGVDAGVDAAPDATPAPGPWTRHTITSAGVKGADGVRLGDANGDGRLDAVSGWEEGGGVTLSLQPADITGSEWPTVRLGALHPGQAGTTYTTGFEDALIADIDGDGHPDVAGANDGNHRVTIWFAPTDPSLLLSEAAWTQVTIVNDSRHWMQLAWADMDGDGHPDLVAGSRVDPANVGYFVIPANPRVAASWVGAFHQITPAGWTMSLIPRDVDGDGDLDLIVSDRAAIHSTDWTYFGTRWVEHTASGWVNHSITGPQHNGSPKFVWVGDFDHDGSTVIIEPRGDNSAIAGVPFPNHVRILRNSAPDWSGTWSTQEIGDEPDVGTVQSVAAADLDGDGDLDLVVGYSYGHDPVQPTYNSATATNLLEMRNDGDGTTWTRCPLLGTDGVKVDDISITTIDGQVAIIQSEQGDASIPTPPADQLGVFYLTPP